MYMVHMPSTQYIICKSKPHYSKLSRN